MLHVVNGTATQLVVAGDRLDMFDFFMEGPLTDDWSVRAAFLHQHFGVETGPYFAAVDAAHEKLAAADELTLWFEGDVFCLTNLVYVLRWLDRNPRPARLICPADERLGRLQSRELERLYEQRQPVGSELARLGADLWDHPDGDGLDFAALSLLRRVPEGRRARRDGTVDAQIVALVKARPQPFGALFKAFYATDVGRLLGLGDRQFAVYVAELARAGRLHVEPFPSGDPPFESAPGWMVATP